MNIIFYEILLLFFYSSKPVLTFFLILVAGVVCSIEESSGPQNLRVPMVLKASKYAGPKGDVTNKN